MNKPTAAAAPESGSDDPEILALLDFEPVPLRKRVNGWDPEAQRAFIALLAATGSKLQAARAIGRNPAGIDRLLERRDGAGFRAAMDAALALAERRSGTFLAHGIAAASARARGTFPSPSRMRNGHCESDDEDSNRRRAEEARDSIGGKLVRIRRLYLQEISDCPGKRAAFELLTELPVDWELAERLEPQPFEPWVGTSPRQPDMVLTAESGWAWGDIGYGPDRKAEVRRLLDEFRASQGLPPIEWGESAERSDAGA